MRTILLACTALLTASLAATTLAKTPATLAPAAPVRHLEGKLANANMWAADVPEHWNGTVLLFSHGYSSTPGTPRDRAHNGGDELLARGYALLGSSYSQGGWALEQAVPDQIAALDAFAVSAGKPRRVIAYGESMGGLVTAALVERYPGRIDGAMPMCASLSGALGMENQALDGAWALKTLVDPAAPLRIVGVWQPGAPQPPVREEGPAVDALLAKATTSPSGRARLALAAAFAQLPDHPDDKAPPIGSDDLEGRVDAYARWFAMGVFFPRWDQERRAGGNASWNTGVDYTAQLNRSGRRAMVEALYRKAGISLDADLARLASSPRIQPDPKAVAYMRANFVPTGKLRRPVLTLHTTGDGATMITYEQAYAAIVRRAGAAPMLRQVFVEAPGHCTFNAAETVAGIAALDHRIATGRWNAAELSPTGLDRATATIGKARFVAFVPAPFLRP